MSAYGHPEGIEKRLLMWIRQLRQDKTFPWIGTGIVSDMICAAKLLGADVSEFAEKQPEPEWDL